MALYWPDIKRFLVRVARLEREYPFVDMTIDAHGELCAEIENDVRNRLNAMLCSLGRHDYEFGAFTPNGVLLRCFYCRAEKLCAIKEERP